MVIEGCCHVTFAGLGGYRVGQIEVGPGGRDPVRLCRASSTQAANGRGDAGGC